MEDLTGKRLGQYQVLAPLGEGGMAAVYKAYQPGMERHVALKILPRHLASDPEFTGRFEQEAKIIARLQHVHILPVHDFGEQDGYTYIVMPYIETGTLADLMMGEPIPLRQVREVITQVGEALAYAHERGLVHRDVKPSNVLIDEAGNCLLTDFGIAKMVEGTVQFTRTGAIIGTPAYMSPEQIRGDTLDGRSDLYSLGIVLFELATGRPPYRAETPPSIFVKHLHDPLPLPSSMNPDLPEDLDLVILKCLAKEPADRYTSMRDMVESLRRAIPEAELEATRPGEDEGAMAPTLLGAAPPAPAGSGDPVEAAPGLARALPAARPEARLPRKAPIWAWLVGGTLAIGLLAALGVGAFLALRGPPGRGAGASTATPGLSGAVQQPTRAAGEPTQAAADRQAATATDTTVPSPAPSPTAGGTETPVPTETTIPTATAELARRSADLSDEFDAAQLREVWTVYRQNPYAWDLGNRPGWLHLVGEKVASAGVKNAFGMSVPDGDLSVISRIETNASEGQYVWIAFSNGDYSSLDSAYSSAVRETIELGIAPTEQGYSVYMWACFEERCSRYYSAESDRKSVEFATKLGEEPITMDGSVYLKLTREGHAYTGYWSRDGASWAYVGEVKEFAPETPQVFLGAAHDSGAEDFDAYFDFVRYESLGQ